jgi:hypothetical protein
VNCWEFMNCGFERGGERTRDVGTCPAHPEHGRHCARVAGTLCGGKIQGTFALKLASCLQCDYYKSPYYDKTYGGSARHLRQS